MWKRDESVKPAAPPAPTPAAAPPAPAGTAPAVSEPRAQLGRDMVNIGKSVVIKGELSGSEDLTIEGHVEGRIDLKGNVLTIDGDIASPRVAIAEGAHFRGSVDMQRAGGAKPQQQQSQPKASQPTPSNQPSPQQQQGQRVGA